MQNRIHLIVFLLLLSNLTSFGQAHNANNYLVLFTKPNQDQYGYKNQKGEIIIPLGKYEICYTDTFKTYAVVLKSHYGFVAIDRQEQIMYEIYPFDNGPDNTSDGLFRILKNNKIGFADSTTGKIVITPTFNCAWPFENGIAQVSMDCKSETESSGEHSVWRSKKWYYVDRTGRRVAKPKQNKNLSN